jgi:hypothetical protein
MVGGEQEQEKEGVRVGGWEGNDGAEDDSILGLFIIVIIYGVGGREEPLI